MSSSQVTFGGAEAPPNAPGKHRHDSQPGATQTRSTSETAHSFTNQKEDKKKQKIQKEKSRNKRSKRRAWFVEAKMAPKFGENVDNVVVVDGQFLSCVRACVRVYAAEHSPKEQ